MTSAKSLIISTKLCFNRELVAIGSTEETFTEVNLKKAYGSSSSLMEVTYDSRIYRWIATFPFPTKCPDNSYSHRGGCWSRGMFYHLTGMSLMGDAISHAVLPGVALSFILGIDFFIERSSLA